jgi:Rad52/22 family double-strand break repair protein
MCLCHLGSITGSNDDRRGGFYRSKPIRAGGDETMTQFPDLFAALAAPFDAQQVRVRSHSGREIQYITARTAMNRLDSVLGPENWWDEYTPGENSVLCRLTVRLPDGTTLTKADAGGYAGMADSGDDDKSGFSDAFKRAAVKFGVGRYLYRDGVPSFGGLRTPDAGLKTNEPTNQSATIESRPTESSVPGPESSEHKAPRSGRALFAWTKDQEARHKVGLLKYLNSWAKLQDFPGRMVDWDTDQVNQAYAEGVRKLQSISNGHAEAYEEALAN